jgi:DNA-binding transcriptional ArsR family regulator
MSVPASLPQDAGNRCPRRALPLDGKEPDGYITTMELNLDTTFAALADPTRRAILARLAKGEATVMELAEPFPITQPAISKHLKVLENAGLISTGQDAQRRPRKIEPAALEAANQWLERYRGIWDANYARLDVLLETLKQDAKKTTAKKRKK